MPKQGAHAAAQGAPCGGLRRLRPTMIPCPGGGATCRPWGPLGPPAPGQRPAGCRARSRQCRSAGRGVGAPVALNISLAPPNPGYRVRGDTIGGTNPWVRPDYCAKPGYLATTGSTPRKPSVRARRRPIRGGLRGPQNPPRRLTWGGVSQSMVVRRPRGLLAEGECTAPAADAMHHAGGRLSLACKAACASRSWSASCWSRIS